MTRHRALAVKIIVMVAMFFIASCTLQVEIPSVKLDNSQSVEVYDISESYKSVAMVAIRPKGSTITQGIGTAFAINENNLMTAGHVCSVIQLLQSENAITSEIWLVYLGRSDKLAKRTGAKIIAVDPVNDICQLSAARHGLMPLKFANYDTVKFNDQVYITGAPSGIMISISDGKVMNRWSSGLSPNLINDKLIISSATTGGHSGSPVLNDRGEVIGMLVLGHQLYDHLSFAVPEPILERFVALVGLVK